jgi:hypothetical protein
LTEQETGWTVTTEENAQPIISNIVKETVNVEVAQ